jgi:hypothetical protein
MEFGTSPAPMRAHVQNSAVAVSGAGLRIMINGAPLFDLAIMAEADLVRQGNNRVGVVT